MAVQCAWASMSEKNGKNGAKGDQTKKEVKIGVIYDFGQTKVYRCNDREKAILIGSAAKAIAINDYFGYGQSDRASSYTELQKTNWNVSKVKTLCNIDCSELGACAVNIAYKDDLISSSVYSGNIGKALKATGLFAELSDKKYLGKSEYIQAGDIIVAPGSHVIVAYTDGSKSDISVNTNDTSNLGSADELIKIGQQQAIEFTGINIRVDGKVGKETKKMMARVLQHAINLDYNKKLVEDGIFGKASITALGTHYITKGEKQYMVTAAEILMYLNCIDPNDVEYPGVYGNGLVYASKTKFCDDGLKIAASEFLKLL